MSLALLLEQLLNGLQFGLMLFLLSVGVTLIFGVMNLVNISHGSLFMLAAFFTYTAGARWGYGLGLLIGLGGTIVVAILLEWLVIRRLYKKSHLDQVLGTFGLMLIFNELVRIIWGTEPIFAMTPDWLAGSVQLSETLYYPTYRLAITAVAIVAGIAIWLLLSRTRIGMLVRAGADKRETVEALGVNINFLFAVVFVVGAVLAALAGIMMGPLITVESGIGDPLLILALVVIVVGGAGSLKGCLAASLLIGMIDTLSRALVTADFAGGAGRALSSMSVYLLMLAVLLLRPQGLFSR